LPDLSKPLKYALVDSIEFGLLSNSVSFLTNSNPTTNVIPLGKIPGNDLILLYQPFLAIKNITQLLKKTEVAGRIMLIQVSKCPLSF